MKELSQDQLQSILDNYSVGKIIDSWVLSNVSVDGHAGVNLSRSLAETNQGLYIITFTSNDDLHGLWWSSDAKDFVATLAKALKLKNAKLLLTNENSSTVHKFDLRISVFSL
ncbi:MAG: hypothetical protein ABI425_00010 [Patescibacteria group bacterium]